MCLRLKKYPQRIINSKMIKLRITDKSKKYFPLNRSTFHFLQ